MTALLERAAELQVRATRRAENRPGLTLAELEAIAAEAGLDPSHLRQAAAELDDPGRPLVGAGTGTTASHVYVERWLPGALTPEAWEDVVAELRHRYDNDMGRMMGMPGYGVSSTEQIGRTVEWRHTSLSGVETRVMIRPSGEGLRLRLSQRVGWGSPPAEASTYGGLLAILGGLLANALSSSAALGLVTFIAVLAAAVPLILFADRSWRRKKHAELIGLADHLEQVIATAAPAATPSAETTARHERKAPVLDAALEAPSQEAPPARTRTRA